MGGHTVELFHNSRPSYGTCGLFPPTNNPTRQHMSSPLRNGRWNLSSSQTTRDEKHFSAKIGSLRSLARQYRSHASSSRSKHFFPGPTLRSGTVRRSPSFLRSQLQSTTNSERCKASGAIKCHQVAEVQRGR
jgi:hypothetical protein